ncbi:hypothetical protein [uncultured Desulfovibrio sp.]|uniref:hypothetical protein n=1 Tax=uncultured Desulfovibrio sp. TaxID=167968 RepID=UPI002868DE3A|nr:hypothetical protein [uncultured Desulfovibrio sp.]
MSDLPMKKLPPDTLTVIIRDDSPMVYCNDSPSFRTVRISLTSEQREAIMLRNGHESISMAIIEEASK